MNFCLIPVQKWFNFSLVKTDLILYLSSTGCWIKDPYSEYIHVWYALQTCLSLEQEPHYWQEQSMGFQRAIFRRNVCLELIMLTVFLICLPVSWIWKHSPECRSLCGPFDVCCWPVSLTSCSEGVPAPALLVDLFCRWGKAPDLADCSCFIPALVQWGSSAGNGAVTQLERPTALLQGWEKDECSSLHSVESALKRSCVRGCWGMQLGHAGLKALPVALVDREQKDVLSMDKPGKQGYLPSLSTHALEPVAE